MNNNEQINVEKRLNKIEQKLDTLILFAILIVILLLVVLFVNNNIFLEVYNRYGNELGQGQRYIIQ